MNVSKSRVIYCFCSFREYPGAIIGALGFNSGRESNKLQNVRHKILREGAPVVQEVYAVGSYARFVILLKQQHILSSLAAYRRQ